MNAAILIATRELRDKTRLFLTALALAILPFIASVMPMLRQKGDPNLVVTIAGILAFSLGVGTSVILGATTIGRPLSDGRLSFYFSKPIAPASIWIGKATAALIATAASFAIVALPSWLYARGEWSQTWSPIMTSTLLGSLVVFFVMHAASTMVRSRSALLAIDFLLAAATVGAIFIMLRPFAFSGATRLLSILGLILGIGFVLVLAIAPAFQLAFGRTDRRRSHAALSKALWPGVAIVLLAGAAFVGWVVSATPDDLSGQIVVAQTPATGWTFISGRALHRADYQASFLIDPKGGIHRTGPMWWSAAFSRDGGSVAWAEPVNPLRPREMEIYTRDLTRDDARPVATGIRLPFGEFVLSDDGRRIAIDDGHTLSIHDLGAKRLLFSARLFEVSHHGNMFFVSPNLVRVIHAPWQTRAGRDERVTPVITEVDVARRTVTNTGTVEPVRTSLCVASPDGSRLLFSRNGLLVDGRTGATIARYGDIGMWPAILRDGTVVVQKKTTIAIQRPDSAIDVALPGKGSAYIRGEVAPGKIAVQHGGSILIIDARTGVIERTYAHMQGPLVTWSPVDPRPLPIDTGRPLIVREGRHFAFWNPKTGERTPLGIGQ